MSIKHFIFMIVTMTVSVAVSAQTPESVDTVPPAITTLDEAAVTAARVKHDAHSDEYLLTPELIRGAQTVYEVLSRLPGVAYRNITREVSVRMDNRVLIEVDGKRVTEEYLQALPIDRMARVQIIYAPAARYTTDGIRYVINVKLKNDYLGHELYVSNFTMLSAGDNNGANPVPNEQPKVQYTYSGKSVDVTAGYGYGTIHWNYLLSYVREYNGLASVKTGAVDTKHPNDLNATESHAGNMGMDWQIAPYQTLSVRGNFQRDDTRHRSTYDVTEHETGDAAARDYRERSIEQSVSKEGSAALYYQGMFRNGWSVYSAMGYNRLRDNTDTDYGTPDFGYAAQFRNAKDYFRGELDLNYSFSDALTLNFGYRGVWNLYTTRDREKSLLRSKDKEGRHNGYVFLDWTPKENFMLHAGTGVEAIHKSGLAEKRRWTEFLPQVTVTWQPSEKVQLMAEYATKMEYPSLYEVSASPAAIDRWLMQTGNTQLSPTRRQTVSLQGVFFNALVVGAEYDHARNAITDWYEKTDGNTFIKTFTNARSREFKAFAAYNWAIAKGLTWGNMLLWHRANVARKGVANHAVNLVWQSSVEYWIAPIGLQTKVEYMRSMLKNPLLQGWQQYGQDLWQVSLSKRFIHDNLSVSLNYVPPIRWGMRENQKSCVQTDFLKLRQNLNLHTYDNLLLLRLEWRFNKGRDKQRQTRQYEFDTERKQDNGLL